MDAAAKRLLKEAVVRSASDPAYFLRFFFPHWFPSQIPPFHLGIIALITKKVRFLDNYTYAHEFLLEHFEYMPDHRAPDEPPVKVFQKDANGRLRMVKPKQHLNEVVPRGFSKTTLMKGICAYELITDKTTFAVFISETSGHSETQVTDIKMELESNVNLRAAYGDQVPTRSDTEKWTGSELHLLSGAILVAKGRGGQVRGMSKAGKRPNLIMMDDVEDEDSVATQAQLEKTENWFYGSVSPAGQVMDGAEGESWAQKPLQIVNMGTLLGPQCLVMKLSTDMDFSTIKLGAKLENGEMLWGYKMSLSTYDRLRLRFKLQGKLANFCREYDSTIRVDEDSIFPPTFIYRAARREDFVSVALAFDPAISASRKACHCAIVVAGRRQNGSLSIIDEWGGIGKSPTEQLDAIMAYHRKWNCTHAGIEAIQYQAALLPLLQEKMAKEKYFFICQPIRQGSKDSKMSRIQGVLSPRYMNGYLDHARPLHNLEGNIADFPSGLVDYMDAASMALGLLGETSGLMMEGAMDPEPEQTLMIPPELLHTVGNYRLHTRNNHLKSGRYG